MPTEPQWPPELVEMSESGNDWGRYCDALYDIFHGDFIARSTKFLGKHVTVRPKDVASGKALRFWHVISEGPDEDARLTNLRRCECIRWPRRIIEAVGTERVKWWRERRERDLRTHVALADFSYLVVLAESPNVCVLITAYPIADGHSRKRLARRFEAAAEKG